MRLRINTILKRFGQLCNFKKKTKTVTNEFYQSGTLTFEDVQYYVVVVPARAYNIHSNLYSAVKDTGKENTGIIEIYIENDTNLDVGDLYVDKNGVEYEINSIEYWQEYKILGAKRK